MSLRVCVCLFLFVFTATAFPQTGEAVLSSPDSRLAITFQTVAMSKPGPRGGRTAPTSHLAPAGGQLVYSVTFQGRPLIQPSVLGLDLQGQPRLGSSLRLVNTAQSKTDDTYRLVHGKASWVRNNYHALRMELEEIAPPNRKLTMEARAYDDAVAFRYLVPEQAALSEFRLAKEATEFRFSKDPIVYAQMLPNYLSSYESEYIKLSASSLANQGGVRSTILVGLPLLAELPGVGWVTIVEADLRDYAAMYLVNPSGSWTDHWFEAALSPQIDRPEVAVTGKLPRSSAWRVLMVADNPARFIESNVLTSLNPESVIKDTSWIRAGRAAWDWWNGSQDASGKRAFTTDNMKYYVDFAAKSGLEYMLVDAGWSAPGDITKMNGRVDIPELVRYAKTKNVKVWIWVGSSALMKQMDEAIPVYAKWGVAGIKTDFVLRDDQVGTDFYYRSAAKAAEYKLMID